VRESGGIVPDAPLASNVIGVEPGFASRQNATERVHTNAVCLCITRSTAVMTQFTVTVGVLCYHFNMQILQITDPHLYGSATGRLRGVETDSSLHAVLDDAFARVPGLLGCVGDRRSRAGRPFRLSALSQHLRQSQKAGAVHSGQPRRAGGHAPRALRRAVSDLRHARSIDGWQFIMLDSYDPGHVGGRLTPPNSSVSTRARRSPKHAMVCLHHHPIAMGSRWLDTVGLANSDEFWRIIDAHAHVRAVVWGHVHQAYDGNAVPCGCSRLRRPARNSCRSDRYAVDSRPPAYRSFVLHADGASTPQVHWVESTPAMRQVAAR
jgi:3',5'-cyclic-AMP phosphodiesterase